MAELDFATSIGIAAEFITEWITTITVTSAVSILFFYLWQRQPPSDSFTETLHGISISFLILIGTLLSYVFNFFLIFFSLVVIGFVTIYHVTRLIVKLPFDGFKQTGIKFKFLYFTLKTTTKDIVGIPPSPDTDSE